MVRIKNIANILRVAELIVFVKVAFTQIIAL